MKTALFVLAQALGLAGLLFGVLLLWGVGWAFLVGGVLVLAGATALEAASGLPARRSGPNGEGVV